jgi:polar amino acid transport system substrate-binding protein
LFIKPEREKVVDFVPYMYSSNTVLVKASTRGVTGAGKPAIDIRLFAKDSDALQQLKIGLMDAYRTTHVSVDLDRCGVLAPRFGRRSLTI